MIKKLSQNIFWLIMIALSTITLGIILLFTFLNYQNTINSRVSMIEKVSSMETRKNPNGKQELKAESQVNIEGIYEIVIENSQIVQSIPEQPSEEIQEYALKVSLKNQESGIIGNYIYKIKKMKDNKIHVSLMEDKNAILSIQKIFVLAILMCVLSIAIIYIIAKKVSKVIVKPVEETFKKQKEFISDASHELKTPLAVIAANADVLENELGKNKWLTYIQTEVESMNKLINELLLLAKIENIDNIKEYGQFDVAKEVEIVVSMFESMAYEKKVKLRTNITQNIILNGNKEDIEHIVSTLLDNAIKHTNEGKEVIVELCKEKNEIILQVKNNGEPIPEEEKDKIFERFYRIDKARNRQEKRYGLGLAIAKSTVEKYKGKIEVLYKEGFNIFKVSIPTMQKI